MAKAFQEEFHFPGKLFTDPKREVYKALGCNRGLRYFLSGNAVAAYKKAGEQGYTGGGIAGDALQLGGCFVMSVKQGLVFQHLEKFPGDHADNNTIYEVCKKHRGKA